MQKQHLLKVQTLLLTFLFVCCNNPKTTNGKIDNRIAIDDTQNSPPKKRKYFPITWIENDKVTLDIDSNLSYRRKAFNCDSVIAIDYVGFEKDHSFYPINENGMWISTILKTKKLTISQNNRFNKILGDYKTFENPRMVACYEPRLALIYFKNNKVIAQTQICLTCAGLNSTVELGSRRKDGLFNQNATDSMDNLRKELNFSESDSWYKN